MKTKIPGPAVLLILIALSGCSLYSNPVEDQDTELIEKVKIAMFCTQKKSWEFGVAMQALIELGDQKNLVLMADEAVLRATDDGRLAMVGSEANIADTAANGPGVLAAHAITGNEKFMEAAKAQYEFLMLPSSRNTKGTIYHNTKRPIIFSDNMFMIAPFLAQMGDYDEAMFQIEAIRRVLWNEEAKLFHHTRFEETGKFSHEKFWGGGNGWCAAAMGTVIDILPDARMEDKERLMKYTKDLLDGCIAHQLPSGLFYDYITEPNFEESTTACMLAFTIYKGVKSGWLEKSYLEYADKMRKGAHANIDEYGMLQKAAGSPWFNKPGTSTEGQAFFLMMEAAYRKLHEAER